MVHRMTPLIRGGLVIVLALVVGACAANASGGGPGGAAADGSATIRFASPMDGAQVTIPFTVQLESNVPLGAPETGDHHAHLYFDTSTDAPDYDIVYGTTWQVTRALTPGQHKLTVALANPDHSPAGPTQQITVTVVGAGASPAASPAAPVGPTY